VVGDVGFAHEFGAQTQGVPYGMSVYYPADFVFKVAVHGIVFFVRG